MQRRSCLLSLVLTFVPIVARASIVVALPEPALIARADTIVFGVVLNTRTLVQPTGVIATQAELQVYEGLRGAKLGEIITLEVPGGRLNNGLVAVSAGAPTFAPGDIIFGFLETTGSVRRPLGLSYGILRAQPDENGRYLLYRDQSDLILVSPTGAPIDPNGSVIHGLPLEELTKRVTQRLVEIGIPGPGEVRP
jgi:hypothetical protein